MQGGCHIAVNILTAATIYITLNKIYIGVILYHLPPKGRPRDVKTEPVGQSHSAQLVNIKKTLRYTSSTHFISTTFKSVPKAGESFSWRFLSCYQSNWIYNFI
jgi:hypothetical protein